LADWLVPVHYIRREVSFPEARTARSGNMSLDAALDLLRKPDASRTGTANLDPVGSFVGRDSLFYALETATRMQRVVVLHGPGGTGKTELAKAFGRWWRDTGGAERPEWVIWHSFESGGATFGLDGVVAEIGMTLFGPEFARLATAERRGVVERVLAERRMLLLWDNFETVYSMPDPAGATQPLDQKDSEELRDFLARIAQRGNSAVVITSRTPEDWLGHIRRIPVAGLAPHEAVEYAADLLAPYPNAAPRRARRAFGELMEWLDGHPLSMRLILPHLNTTDPEDLLADLRGTAALPGSSDIEAGKTSALARSIAASFSHLTDPGVRLLPIVSLFESVADVNVLALFSSIHGVPERFRDVSRDQWLEALDDAAGVGLLASIGSGFYRIHPALPAYLTAQWRNDEPTIYDIERKAATRAFVEACAAFGSWLGDQIYSGDAGIAYMIIELEYRTFGTMMGYAIEHALWDEALAIVQPLAGYWDARGLAEEADAWTARIRIATENSEGQPPIADSSAGRLWFYVVSVQARRQRRGLSLDEAARTYSQVLDMLKNQPASVTQQRNLAITCYQLGMVAQDRGRLDDAESWYLKSLDIDEQLGNQPAIARSYHQLGNLAYLLGRLDDAESWYLKSLDIDEQLGNQPATAASYHQLGNLAYMRNQPHEAERQYRRALSIEERLGDRPGMAVNYHQLGMLAQDHDQPDDAEDWYAKSLAIKTELGDRPGMADTFEQLGALAQQRGRLEDAWDWHSRALLIKEELGDRPGMADTYHQLGNLAHLQGRLQDAKSWYERSLGLKDRSNDQAGIAVTYSQLGAIALAGGRLDEAEEHYMTSLAISQGMGDKAAMAIIFGQLGLLATARGRVQEALEQTIRCLALFEELLHAEELPRTAAGPWLERLSQLTDEVSMATLRESWEIITGSPLPEDIYVHVLADLSQKGDGKR
jgi:tetratricopeptide (TPR) repeat protein